MQQTRDTSDQNWEELHGHRKRKPRVKPLHERIVRGEIPGQRPDSLLSRRQTARRRRTAIAAERASSAQFVTNEDLPPPL